MSLWLKRVLVPVDLSPLSREALRYAAFLADVYGASLHVLHVVRAQTKARAPWQAADAKQRVEAVLREMAMGSAPAHVIVARGDEPGPAWEALRSAYDLVVLPGDCSRGDCPGGGAGCSLIRRILESSANSQIRVDGPVRIPFMTGSKGTPHNINT